MPDSGLQITVAFSAVAALALSPCMDSSRSVAVFDCVSGSENESLSVPFWAVPR